MRCTEMYNFSFVSPYRQKGKSSGLLRREKWGYTVADARCLQAEMEQQALEKYFPGSML